MKRLNEHKFVFGCIFPAVLGCIIAAFVIIGGAVALKLVSLIYGTANVYYDLIFGI